MTNRPRRFIDQQYYHIYGRGNHRDVVFREGPDRIRFLSKLEEFCERDGQSIIAYCLMDNHYHLALRQNGERPLSETMRSLLQGYALYYNRRYGTVGSLFQGRFQSKLVDNPLHNPWHLARLTRYIHRNPLLFADFRYRWSSYRQYVGETRGACDTGPVMELFEDCDSYVTFCAQPSASERQGEGRSKWLRVAAEQRL